MAMTEDTEVLQMFMEESLEHLAEIESDLMDIEQAGADSDEDLVNKVFRAAHSIKGGAACLGLEKIKELSHAIENVLHLVRTKEITPDRKVVEVLLAGFDFLRGIISDSGASEQADISGLVASLTSLAAANLPEGKRESISRRVDIVMPTTGKTVFSISEFDLSMAGKGGNFVYLVEYDLIHDVQRMGKTPLSVIRTMEKSGNIVAGKVDVQAVGTLDDEPGNAIPFYVLFSTIIDPEYISALFGAPRDKIHLIPSDPALLPQSAAAEPAPAPLAGPAPAVHIAEPLEPAVCEREIYHIRFKPEPGVFLSGIDLLSLLDELRGLGRSLVVAHLEDVPPLEDLDPNVCYISFDILTATSRDENDLRDVFIFVQDSPELNITRLECRPGLDSDEAFAELSAAVSEKGALLDEDLARISSSHRVQAAPAPVAPSAPAAPVAAPVQAPPAPRPAPSAPAAPASRPALAKPAAPAQPPKAPAKAPASSGMDDSMSSIRVPANRLDKLVDLVGELVIVQARLSQTLNEQNFPALPSIAEEIERLSNELRDSTLNIRMLPFGTTFTKFRRLVRDLSTKLGKEIELVTKGAETELDKTVIERLNDPMVHLLRNSIDHGIETPDVREAAGKSAKGTITLDAEHSGGEVHIKIIDDGAGLDPERIKAKAVQKGLIAPEAEFTPADAALMIFAPGFSTAAAVTDVSGRGVGMDVVKRNIEALRGRIEIESEKGKGTTITVILPLTLAIIDGLQVRVGEEFYVMPLSAVEECVELVSEGVPDKQRIINLRGEIVPYIRVQEWFGVDRPQPKIEQIVITRVEGQRAGFVVDEVVGQHQTVIKSLGRVYRDVEGISGATIKGDGTIALILDVNHLFKAVLRSTGS